MEVESVGVAGKFSSQQTIKKYFRMELTEKEQQDIEEDLDSRELEEGFVSDNFVFSLSTYPLHSF